MSRMQQPASSGDAVPHPRRAVHVDVSGHVRRVRRRADLSQRELATRIGRDQSTVARIEGGQQVDVRTFERILNTAGLRIAVVDAAGVEVTPMGREVFRDRAGRRLPAHLDVHARPEHPTIKMLLHAADPVPASGAWLHLRRERDRLRRLSGLSGADEQLDVQTVRQRQQEARLARIRARVSSAAPRAGPRYDAPPIR